MKRKTAYNLFSLALGTSLRGNSRRKREGDIYLTRWQEAGVSHKTEKHSDPIA